MKISIELELAEVDQSGRHINLQGGSLLPLTAWEIVPSLMRQLEEFTTGPTDGRQLAVTRIARVDILDGSSSVRVTRSSGR